MPSWSLWNAFSRRSSRERRSIDDAFALLNGDDLIGGDTGEGLDCAARPQDLQTVDGRRLTQPEVSPQIVLPKVAGTRLYLAQLPALADRTHQARARRAAIALGADRTDEEGVACVAALVQQQRCGVAVVGDQQIEVAVVVDVAGGEGTAHQLAGETRTGAVLHVHESSW